MNKVDHSVRENEATAYVHSMITEHSLSPASNNWVIVPAKFIQVANTIRILFIWKISNEERTLVVLILQWQVEEVKG